MKKIFTNKYMKFKKHAQGYPPGVGEGDIEKNFGSPEYDIDTKGTGEFEILRNWDKYWEGSGYDKVDDIFTGESMFKVIVEYEIEGFEEDPPSDWNFDYQVKKIYDMDNNRDVSVFELSYGEEDQLKEEMIEEARRGNI